MSMSLPRRDVSRATPSWRWRNTITRTVRCGSRCGQKATWNCCWRQGLRSSRSSACDDHQQPTARSPSTIEKSSGVTDTERMLADFYERSFLKLWSHPNPYEMTAMRSATARSLRRLRLHLLRSGKYLAGGSSWADRRSGYCAPRRSASKRARQTVGGSGQTICTASSSSALYVEIPDPFP